MRWRSHRCPKNALRSSPFLSCFLRLQRYRRRRDVLRGDNELARRDAFSISSGELQFCTVLPVDAFRRAQSSGFIHISEERKVQRRLCNRLASHRMFDPRLEHLGHERVIRRSRQRRDDKNVCAEVTAQPPRRAVLDLDRIGELGLGLVIALARLV